MQLENELVVDYTITANASDGQDFIELIETTKNDYNKTPEMATADGGYGNEENYDYCEKENIKANLKPITLNQEQTANEEKNKYKKINFKYNEEKDEYICPEKKHCVIHQKRNAVTQTVI